MNEQELLEIRRRDKACKALSSPARDRRNLLAALDGRDKIITDLLQDSLAYERGYEDALNKATNLIMSGRFVELLKVWHVAKRKNQFQPLALDEAREKMERYETALKEIVDVMCGRHIVGVPEEVERIANLALYGAHIERT